MVPREFAGSQIRIRFEGVDSSFHCWVNGSEVGYSQGARNPSEFDITDLLLEGENTLSVRVYQFCDGSYIEDQGKFQNARTSERSSTYIDQWWLSGIFRDVYLLAFPKRHIQDFQIETQLDSNYADAVLSARVEVIGDGDLQLALYDEDRASLIGESTLQVRGSRRVTTQIPVTAPQKWTAESPRLYHLIIRFGDQIISQKVGFRKVEIKDGLIVVNGRRIVFRGTNRHEHHPTMGRAVPYEFLRRDLVLMKRHNINAIRTSHQPSDSRLYDLADELGFWVMDEADLECHGFDTVHERSLPESERHKSFEEKKAITYGNAGKWLSDNQEWEDAYVDRAKHLVHRDKNHPSVVMWSLGNEAFYGRNFQAMYDWIKMCDNSRPIHYEGDFKAQTVDMFSLMYPPLSTIINFAENWDGKKPMVLCEYIHAMGNGPGAIKEYVDLFYKYPCLQGGWAWEWANHGLLTKNLEGEEYFAYGGDFGEYPHDGNFVMDGLVDSQHRPGPGLIEYKKAIEPVQLVEGSLEKVTIINRHDFSKMDHFKCSCRVVGDGFIIEGSEILIPEVLPGQTTTLSIPTIRLGGNEGEAFLELSFRLKEATIWADVGQEIASFQIPISLPMRTSIENPITEASTIVISKISQSVLCVKGSDAEWRFDLVKGRLTTWVKNAENILHTGPELSLFRALTDNDGTDGKDWIEKELHHIGVHTWSAAWYINAANGTGIIKCAQRIAPPSLEWSIDAVSTYTFHNSSVTIHLSGKPQGMNLPLTLPRIGLSLSLPSTFTKAAWFGRGSGESYKDKKLSQKFGNYLAAIDDLAPEYEFPQESGNHTETRWVRFYTSTGGVSLKASFVDKPEGFDFQASHYNVFDVHKSKHPYELRKIRREEVIVRLDADHHGLGTGSCGMIFPSRLTPVSILIK